MSETIEATTEPIEPPSKSEIEQWMTELEQQGVPVELKCGQCGSPTETRVPREEANDKNQKTLCRKCVESLI